MRQKPAWRSLAAAVAKEPASVEEVVKTGRKLLETNGERRV